MPRKKSPRAFRCEFHLGEDTYVVAPLATHPEVASKAYRLAKRTGDRNVYDVRLTEHGPECECKGFLRHGHCKHVEMLTALGCLPAGTPCAQGVAS